MKKAILAIGAAGLLASACATDPYGNSGPNETVRQGAIGAGRSQEAGGADGQNCLFHLLVLHPRWVRAADQ